MISNKLLKGENMSTNDITGDPIKTGATSKEYEQGYDAIFGKKVKPTVRYKEYGDDFIEVGYGALVYTLDHPHAGNYGDKVVKTSKVISYNKATGDFETQNTLYVKAKTNA